MDNVEKVFEEKMQKTMNVLKNELNAVRAGRANPALLDKVIVEYYGTPTPLKNLSNISGAIKIASHGPQNYQVQKETLLAGI